MRSITAPDVNGALTLGDCTDPFDHVSRGQQGKQPATPPVRYFFHLVKGPTRIPDRTGVELHEDVIATSAVLDVVREIWPGTVDRNAWAGWSVQIVDPQGRVVRLLAL